MPFILYLISLQGVMISHDNLTWTAGVCSHLYELTEVLLQCLVPSSWYRLTKSDLWLDL